MRPVARVLQRQGYDVVNLDYPSRHHDITTLADIAVGQGLAACQQATQVHFVTHSLGGILLRQYLAQHEIPGLGRTVMLAPPNQGSEVVDTLRDAPGYRWLNGPAGLQLGTGRDDGPRGLGPVGFEVGVIAGTRSINLLLSTLLPDPDDGKVSVASAKVEGMADFVTVPYTHPLIMRAPKVHKLIVNFLAHGRFKDD